MESMILAVSPAVTPLVIPTAPTQPTRPSRAKAAITERADQPAKRAGRGRSIFTVQVEDRGWLHDRHVPFDRRSGQRRWSNIHLNIRLVFSNDFNPVTAYYEPLLRSAKFKTITHFELPRMAKNPQSEMEQYIAYLVSKIGCNHDFVHIYIFPTTVERPDEMAEHQLYLNV